jgi:hypothetical protein
MSLYPNNDWFIEKYGEPSLDEPVCPGPDCTKCNGEFCEQHGVEPCNCDVLDRHNLKVNNDTPRIF